MLVHLIFTRHMIGAQAYTDIPLLLFPFQPSKLQHASGRVAVWAGAWGYLAEAVAHYPMA